MLMDKTLYITKSTGRCHFVEPTRNPRKVKAGNRLWTFDIKRNLLFNIKTEVECI